MLKKILCVCLCFAFMVGFLAVYADNAENQPAPVQKGIRPIGEGDSIEKETVVEPEVCEPCGREIQLKAEIYNLLVQKNRLEAGVKRLNQMIWQKEKELNK